jgi:hypothetical protein
VLAAAAAFYGRGLARAGGAWPIPLDDVYIHFGFARSAASGHPFEGAPGNGYSSGGTSLTYPFVLAAGYLLGFRGERLGIFAALVAVVALVDLCRSLRAVAGSAPRWVAWAVPPLVLAVPLLDWSWFSGMETALFGALLGRALRSARAAEEEPPARRAGAQLRAGVYAALLVATRPEAVALALLLAVAVVHAAGALRTLPSLARAVGPTVALLALQGGANRLLTGEWSAAGAVRKMLWSFPYPSHLEVAADVIKNLAVLGSQAIENGLGGAGYGAVVPLLGLCGALDRRTRRLCLPLLLGAAGSLALVAFNDTARFQNYRYAAPALAMLLAAAVLGAAALARRGRIAEGLAIAAVIAAVVAPAHAFPRQIDHFARASRNIAEQQVEVARRVGLLHPRRVLVNDAGAIPYLSGVPSLDGLGLGGFRGLPFARASVHGVPAVVELIERLPLDERPDLMALYPSWWKGLADVFGRPVDRVRIEDNVICGADEKVIYEADWSALAPPGEVRSGAVDAVDVGDLVDEKAHGYELPARVGGWVIEAVLAGEDGRPRFDAGRIVPEGNREAFTVAAFVPAAPTTLALRTDGEAEAVIEIERVGSDGAAGAKVQAVVPRRQDDRWVEVRAPLGEVKGGDVVRIHAVRGAWRSFHAWLMRERG